MAHVQGPATLPSELARCFADWPRAGDANMAATDAQLAQWLHRAAVLAQCLPNRAAVDTYHRDRFESVNALLS